MRKKLPFQWTVNFLDHMRFCCWNSSIRDPREPHVIEEIHRPLEGQFFYNLNHRGKVPFSLERLEHPVFSFFFQGTAAFFLAGELCVSSCRGRPLVAVLLTSYQLPWQRARSTKRPSKRQFLEIIWKTNSVTLLFLFFCWKAP